MRDRVPRRPRRRTAGDGRHHAPDRAPRAADAVAAGGRLQRDGRAAVHVVLVRRTAERGAADADEPDARARASAAGAARPRALDPACGSLVARLVGSSRAGHVPALRSTRPRPAVPERVRPRVVGTRRAARLDEARLLRGERPGLHDGETAGRLRARASEGQAAKAAGEARRSRVSSCRRSSCTRRPAARGSRWSSTGRSAR